jgi:hypothetical protein
MKGNIKKLVLLMIITVMALFIMAATVTAKPPVPHAIRGQYASTAGGTCFLAVCGFDANNVPLNDMYQTLNYTSEEVYTFEPDGTGNVSWTSSNVIYPTPSTSGPPTPVPSAGIDTATWDFTYAVAGDRSVTITEVPDSFTSTWISGPLKGTTDTGLNGYKRTGTITQDAKMIILNGGLPDIITFTNPLCPFPDGSTQMICSYSATLIRRVNSPE